MDHTMSTFHSINFINNWRVFIIEVRLLSQISNSQAILSFLISLWKTQYISDKGKNRKYIKIWERYQNLSGFGLDEVVLKVESVEQKKQMNI